MAADWGDYLDRVATSLRTGRRPNITHTIERVQAESGTKMTLDSLRQAGYWNAASEGRPDFDAAAKKGLAIEAHKDEAGKVVAITFRLADA
jgi:hypothetical protein